MKKLIILIALILVALPADGSAGEQIKILFPEVEGLKQTAGNTYEVDRSETMEPVKYTEYDLKEFIDKFKGYDVQQIEIWVEGKVSTGGITKFIVSTEGGGGCKLVLKPK